MSQYGLSDITDIYWAENSGFKGGRDPMGIQNSSVATYACLLPGLTNLTGRIRYYSLYCWLLSEYNIIERERKSEIHQYNFIRRAELLMAFIMKNCGEKSVIGSDFISQGRFSLLNDDVYDLADGSDYESSDKYWAYRSGAFGQYYLGSLIYFNLVKVEDNRFYLRDKGKEIAVSVKGSVDESVRTLFLECILTGRLREADIADFQPLALNGLKIGSSEWNMLNTMFVAKNADGPSFRRDTVFLMLDHLRKGESVKTFVPRQFDSFNRNDVIEAARGWGFYYLCEALHYSIESILCLILVEMHKMRNPAHRLLVEKVKEEVLKHIGENRLRSSVGEWRDDCHGDVIVMFEALKHSVGNKDYQQAVAQSMNLMLRLSNEYESNKNFIEEFERKNKLSGRRGILSEGLSSYVTRYLSISPDRYVATLINQVMNEHTIVALGKMGNSNADLRKFIYDDGSLIWVETRYPSETSPRIYSLYNFLVDLKYLDCNGRLSAVAIDYLEKYGN